MKSFKILVASLLLAFTSLGASAQNKFVNDQLDGNNAANGAKSVALTDVFTVRLPAGTTNVVITKFNGTTETWAGGWAIFDRFVSGPRNQGADFNYYQDPSTGDHVKVGYSAIASTVCTSSPYGGTTRFDVAMTKKAIAGGGVLNAYALTASLCQNFN